MKLLSFSGLYNYLSVFVLEKFLLNQLSAACSGMQ